MRDIASRSAPVTQSPYVYFTAIWIATNSQRKLRLGGSHVAASLSALARFTAAPTARRFNGSFANIFRLAGDHCCAPFCHASISATTWSMSMFDPLRRTYLIVSPVYGSWRVPLWRRQELPDV